VRRIVDTPTDFALYVADSAPVVGGSRVHVSLLANASSVSGSVLHQKRASSVTPGIRCRTHRCAVPHETGRCRASTAFAPDPPGLRYSNV